MLQYDSKSKKYYDVHGFLPFWILINNMDFNILIKYILSFKVNITKQINLNNDILLYSIDLYKNVLNNEKTYDFSKDNIKIVDLLKWFDDLGISIVDIKMKYSEILEKIQCLTEDDIKRVSGIEIGGRDDVNK